LLTGERTALNFLQTLSATATATAAYVAAVAGTGVRILDTRKTLPGLRHAQKYAVRIGGGTNHRTGLFDAILIKENHIRSAGGITAAMAAVARLHPIAAADRPPIEIEVESLAELEEALAAGATRVLLDNFSLHDLASAVAINRARSGPAELEASGNVTLQSVRSIAATGVDFISTGAITKNIAAADLSMLFRID
jgi:nicotinate-nucleotide pyrophosphorylase (carboxylating)